MARQSRHLEMLSAPALALALDVSLFTLQRRTDLPRPIRMAGKQLFFRSEVEHLLPAGRRRYRDAVGAEELAALLSVSVNHVYRMVRAGVLPEPRRIRGRSRWSRANVEAHLKALPRDAAKRAVYAAA